MSSEPSPLTEIVCECTHNGSNDTIYCHDPACGSYAISEQAANELSSIEKKKIAKVLAQRKRRIGKESIKVTIDQIGLCGTWRCMRSSELLGMYPEANEILDEAITNLSFNVQFPSDTIAIDNAVRFQIYAHDDSSESYILRQLTELGLIKAAGHSTSNGRQCILITIESPGWARVQQIRRERPSSNQVFVAMWFDSEMQTEFDAGIEPAILDVGLKCIRIDRQQHNNKICDEIIAEIRRSRFMVADFSGNRGGVYYEAGFAHGLGIPVIWTVRTQDLGDVHFDTRQYNHIVYDSPTDLREKLINRIRATQPNLPK